MSLDKLGTNSHIAPAFESHRDKKQFLSLLAISLGSMPGVGFEPTRPCGQSVLSRSGKPIPPPRQDERPWRDLHPRIGVLFPVCPELRSNYGNKPQSRRNMPAKARAGIAPAHEGFADPRLTTWLPGRHVPAGQTPVLAASPHGHGVSKIS